jgi:hypothetical protein
MFPHPAKFLFHFGMADHVTFWSSVINYGRRALSGRVYHQWLPLSHSIDSHLKLATRSFNSLIFFERLALSDEILEIPKQTELALYTY